MATRAEAVLHGGMERCGRLAGTGRSFREKMAPGFKRVADRVDEHGLAGPWRVMGEGQMPGEGRLGLPGGFVALQFIDE